MDTDIKADTKGRTASKPSSVEFNNWLAGFIDGEGCFSIFKRARVDYEAGYFCRFTLQLRDDDKPILDEIVSRTGIGTVHKSSTDKGRSSVIWEVAGKANCLKLVGLLDKAPLRAKKARDFAIWRQAVLAWQNLRPIYLKSAETGRFEGNRARADWSFIVKCKNELTAIKRYKVENGIR